MESGLTISAQIHELGIGYANSNSTEEYRENFTTAFPNGVKLNYNYLKRLSSNEQFFLGFNYAYFPINKSHFWNSIDESTKKSLNQSKLNGRFDEIFLVTGMRVQILRNSFLSPFLSLGIGTGWHKSITPTQTQSFVLFSFYPAIGFQIKATQHYNCNFALNYLANTQWGGITRGYSVLSFGIETKLRRH